MRTLLLELRPIELIESEIDDLIGQLVTALSSRKTLEVVVDLEPVGLDPERKLAFYRIAQEALNNVARHSEASRVEIRLTSGPPVELVVRDNGVGLDPATVPSGHLGLSIMAERAVAVGAHLDIGGDESGGTTVRLTFDPGGASDG
jgi:signal transduction histidine kinase